MIIQYLQILCNEVITLIGDTIDSGFSNSLSLGVICILGIISSIKIVLYAVYNYGIYYYRLAGDRAKAGLYVNILFSFMSSVLLIAGRKLVPKVFTLEEQYHALLDRCLLIVFSFFVFEAVSVFIGGYLIYIKKMKLAIKASIVYYIVMIALDAVALFKYHSIELILAGSGICNLVYAVVLYFLSGLYKEKYEKGDISTVLKVGLPLFSNRLMSKVSMLILNIFASKLGTLDYAILSVARRSLEIGQTCMNPIVTLNVINFRGVKMKYKELLRKSRDVIVVSSFIFLMITTISLMVIKGNLTYAQLMTKAIPVNIVSLFAYIGWIIVESKLTIENIAKELVFTGVVRIIALAGVCAFSLIDGIGLPVLLLYSFITDTAVAAYGYIKSK